MEPDLNIPGQFIHSARLGLVVGPGEVAALDTSATKERRIGLSAADLQKRAECVMSRKGALVNRLGPFLKGSNMTYDPKNGHTDVPPHSDFEEANIPNRSQTISSTAVPHPNTQTQQGPPALSGNAVPGFRDGACCFVRWW